MKPIHEPGHAVQRVKVGMTGLAIVLLLMGLAGAMFRWVHHDRPAAGAARPELVANAVQANAQDPGGEPLAELGVAPPGQTNMSAQGGGKRP